MSPGKYTPIYFEAMLDTSLSSSAKSVLTLLVGLDNPEVKLIELADMLGLSRMTVSRIVAKLVDASYISMHGYTRRKRLHVLPAERLVEANPPIGNKNVTKPIYIKNNINYILKFVLCNNTIHLVTKMLPIGIDNDLPNERHDMKKFKRKTITPNEPIIPNKPKKVDYSVHRTPNATKSPKAVPRTNHFIEVWNTAARNQNLKMGGTVIRAYKSPTDKCPMTNVYARLAKTMGELRKGTFVKRRPDLEVWIQDNYPNYNPNVPMSADELESALLSAIGWYSPKQKRH